MSRKVGEKSWGDLNDDLEETSDDAKEYISKKIKLLRDEGKPEDQAIAIAYSYAKKKGFKLPEKK